MLGPLALVLVVALFLLGVPAGNDLLLARILPLIQPPRGTITVDRLRAGLAGRVEVTGVSIRDAAGRELYGADQITANLRLGALVGRRVVVDRVEARGLRVGLRDGEECLDPAAPWSTDAPPGPSTPWTGLGFDLDVRAVDVQADLVALCAGLPLSSGPATLSGTVRFDGPRLTADAHLVTEVRDPTWGALDLALRGTWDGAAALVDHLDLALGPNRVRAHGAIRDLSGAGDLAVAIDELLVEPATFGATDVRGALGLVGQLSGTFATPALRGAIATPGGPGAVVASLDLSGERPVWALTLDTPGVALHTFLDVPETTAAGRYTVTGAGFGWPEDLDATVIVDGLLPVAGGQPGPFSVRGTATLHEGAVSLAGVTLGAPGARVGLDGLVRVLESGGTVMVRELEVDLARLEPYGAPGLRGIARFSGALDVRWDQVDVRFAGRLRGAGIGYEDAVRVGTVEGPVRGGYTAAGVDLVAGLALSGLVAPGVTAREVRLDVDVARTTAGSLSGGGTAVLGGLVAAPYALDTTTVAVTLAGDVISAEVVGSSVVGTGGSREQLALVGRHDLGDGTVDLDLLRLAPGARTWTNEGPVHLKLGDGGVTEARLALVSGEARVAVSGAGSPRGPLDLEASVARLPLGAIPDLYPGILTGWAGEVDASARVTGTGRAPVVSLEGSVRGLTIPDAVSALDATLTARSVDGGLAITGQASGPRGEIARIEGVAPVFLDEARRGLSVDAPLDLTLFVPPGDALRLEAVVPGLALGELRASAELRLTGSVARPDVVLVASAQRPIAPGEPWLGVDLDASIQDGALVLRSVVRERLARRAEVSGTASVDLARVSRVLRGEEGAWANAAELVTALSLDVVPLQLPIEALAPAGVAGVTGDLLGGVHVSGDLVAPRVEGAVLVLGGRVGQVAISSAQLEILPRPGLGYGVKLDVGMGDQGGLVVSGTIPWPDRLDGGLDAVLARPGLVLTVQGAGTSPSGSPRGIPLAVLEGVIPGLEGAEGRLEVSGGIIGSLTAPVPAIELSIVDGALALRDTGVRYHGISMAGSVEETAIRVRSLRMLTDALDGGVGRLELDVGRREGEFDLRVEDVSIALDAWTPGQVGGRVELLHARLLDLPNRKVRVTGSLALSGSWPQLALRGDLDVDRGYVSLSESFFTRTDELGLEPEIVVVRPDAVVRAREEEPSFPLPDLDLGVALNRAVDIDVTMPTEQTLGTFGSALSNVRVEANLDGDVDVTATSGEVALSGAVETLRGTVTVLGKPFELQSGAVAFTGRDYADPILTLSADYNSGGYGIINAEIQGTASAPTIALSGQSGLASDDAIAVLLFGQPLSSSDGGSTDALLGMLLTGITTDLKQVGSATALDVVELGLQGSTRVGKRLGRKVLVLLVVDPTPDEGESPLVVSMEVQLPRRWFMVAEYGSLGDTRISAVRKWRF